MHHSQGLLQLGFLIIIIITVDITKAFTVCCSMCQPVWRNLVTIGQLEFNLMCILWLCYITVVTGLTSVASLTTYLLGSAVIVIYSCNKNHLCNSGHHLREISNFNSLNILNFSTFHNICTRRRLINYKPLLVFFFGGSLVEKCVCWGLFFASWHTYLGI